MPAAVTITRDALPKLLATVKRMTAQELLVGIPAENVGRQGEPASNAVIGYVQEFGDPALNIPARPFLIPGVSDAAPAAVKQLLTAGRAALAGDDDAVDRGFNAAGLICQNAVRAKINSNIQPELSQRTLDDRERRGVTRTNTLIDTGQLRNALTYVIRED